MPCSGSDFIITVGQQLLLLWLQDRNLVAATKALHLQAYGHQNLALMEMAMFSISTVFRGMKFEVCRSGRDRSVSAETGDPTGRITRSLRYNQRFGSKIATSIQTHTVLRASDCRPMFILAFSSASF